MENLKKVIEEAQVAHDIALPRLSETGIYVRASVLLEDEEGLLRISADDIEEFGRRFVHPVSTLREGLRVAISVSRDAVLTESMLASVEAASGGVASHLRYEVVDERGELPVVMMTIEAADDWRWD